MSSNATYTPTWLYIKQHNSTGLKYFGKTTSKDPYKYTGSGTYWKRHLKDHGYDFTTIWCQQFFDEQSINEFALLFSKVNNIVESNEWANLIVEDGISGGGVKGRNLGRKATSETRRKMSENHNPNRKPHSDETKKRMSAAAKGRRFSDSTRAKMSEARRNKKWWTNGKSETLSEQCPGPDWVNGRFR